MQNEEIMMRPEKKRGGKESTCRRKLSHCVPESRSLRGIAAQHNMTGQVSIHRRELGPPIPLSSALQFHSPILNRAYTFLCILQVSLIMLNTNFNECLPWPVALGFFVCVAKLLEQGKCDFITWSFNKVFMVTSFALSIFLQLWHKEEMNPNDTA